MTKFEDTVTFADRDDAYNFRVGMRLTQGPPSVLARPSFVSEVDAEAGFITLRDATRREMARWWLALPVRLLRRIAWHVRNR